MPRVEDNPQIQAQEMAKARVQQESLKQGVQALSQFLGDLLKGLLNDLGGKGEAAKQSLDRLGQHAEGLTKSLDQAVDAMAGKEPAKEDQRLAERLDEAVKSGGELDQLRQDIDRAAQSNAEAARGTIDPRASDEQIADQLDARDEARDRQAWLEQASQTARCAEQVQGMAAQVNAISEQARQTATAEEALRDLSQLAEELDRLAYDEESARKRIKHEFGADEIPD